MCSFKFFYALAVLCVVARVQSASIGVSLESVHVDPIGEVEIENEEVARDKRAPEPIFNKHGGLGLFGGGGGNSGSFASASAGSGSNSLGGLGGFGGSQSQASAASQSATYGFGPFSATFSQSQANAGSQSSSGGGGGLFDGFF